MSVTLPISQQEILIGKSHVSYEFLRYNSEISRGFQICQFCECLSCDRISSDPYFQEFCGYGFANKLLLVSDSNSQFYHKYQLHTYLHSSLYRSSNKPGNNYHHLLTVSRTSLNWLSHSSNTDFFLR